MNDAEILRTGELCSALLLSSDFSTIVAQYELSIAADVLATAPHETKKREQLYATLWGARGLLEYMKINSEAAAKIKDADNNPNHHNSTTDYPVDQYDDEGFLRADESNDY